MAFSKFFLLLFMLILGVGGFFLWKNSQPDSAATNFRTVSIERGDIFQTVSANGTLNPVVLVNVGTQVSGTIQRLHADFNGRVQQGQVLAELDPSLFRAQLEQSRANRANAEASLRLAEANERRARALFAKDYIARAEWDQAIQSLSSARAQVAAVSAQVRRDETNLRYSMISSPVSGVVVSRNVDIGQTVAASFQTPTLFTIAQDLQRMQIDTTVAEADVGNVRVGQTVRFAVDAFPNRDFQGTVRQIRLNSQIQQNVVTYNVVIDVANPEEILLPGMTAFVSIVIDQRSDILRLPLAALRFSPIEESENTTSARKEGKTVYRLVQGKLVAVPVRIGINDSRFAELAGGELHEGDALVVEDLRQRKTDPSVGTGSGFRVRMF
jgi:HlyD family secretion protein